MHLYIINGPNLNAIGKREPAIYGQKNFDQFFSQLKKQFYHITFYYFQSNIEGVLIDQLYAVSHSGLYHGIILNAGAYTHTSIALADAIQAIEIPVIDVHISNIFAREKYRKKNRLAKYCKGSIIGFGLYSYTLAVYAFIQQKNNAEKMGITICTN